MEDDGFKLVKTKRGKKKQSGKQEYKQIDKQEELKEDEIENYLR